MAKLDRSKANMNLIKNAIRKQKVYDNICKKDKTIILLELRKTTEQVCPFTGDTYPQNIDWTIEHFYPKSIAEYKHLQLEWTNLFHCVRYANINFLNEERLGDLIYPNIYSPDETDYSTIFIFNPVTGKIRNKFDNDQRANNTIRRYKLNSLDLIEKRKCCYEDYCNNKEYYKNKKQPFYEYFRTES